MWSKGLKWAITIKALHRNIFFIQWLEITSKLRQPFTYNLNYKTPRFGHCIIHCSNLNASAANIFNVDCFFFFFFFMIRSAFTSTQYHPQALCINVSDWFKLATTMSKLNIVTTRTKIIVDILIDVSVGFGHFFLTLSNYYCCIIVWLSLTHFM